MSDNIANHYLACFIAPLQPYSLW